MIPLHPLANLFPLIEGAEFDALVADIRTHGLREPVVLHEGAILDGRNRYRACQAAGLFVGDAGGRLLNCVQFNPGPEGDGDPLAFVLSRNLHRRHLDESQRAMVAARLANLSRPGRPKNNSANLQNISQAEAAALLNVSTRTVADAAKVRDCATPELAAAVDRGTLAVSSAAQAAALGEGTQRRIAEEAAAGRANVVRTVIKQERRAQREEALAAKQTALPVKKFGVILADPEWRFEPRSRETGLDRSPDQHYPTSTTAEIAARPVGDIAAADCVLFLWATAPMLFDAYTVMTEWGFVYKTHLVWRKMRPGKGRGPGYWFTGEHELLLVGTRGAIPAPATALCASVFDASVGEHSAKPDFVAELIERAFPNLPKIELNRRGPARKGWDAWGNEAEPAQGLPEAPDVVAASPRLGAEILALVEQALPADGDGATPRSLHQALGRGALGTMRHALAELVRMGRARADGEAGARRYFRSAALAGAAT